MLKWHLFPQTDPQIMSDVVENRIMTPEERAGFIANILRSSAVEFAKYMSNPAEQPAKHHELMLNHLDNILGDRADVLLICAPPGSAKSRYISVIGPAYTLARRPNADVLMLGSTASLVSGFARQVRNMVASEEFQAVSLNHATLAGDSSAVDDFATTAGGTCRSFGVGGSILGRRADIIFCDDLVASFEVALSTGQLDKLHQWLRSDVLSRLKPGGKIVCIQQRMAREDAYGFFERWFDNTEMRVEKLVLKMQCEEGDEDPLGRSPGDILWAEWFNPKHVDMLRQDPLRWSCMFQQRPIVSESEWCPDGALLIEDSMPPVEEMGIYGMTDLALSVGGGDYSVHVIMGVRQTSDGDRRLWILDMWRKRATPNETVDAMFELVKRWRPFRWLIDDDNMAKSLRPYIQERMMRTNTTFDLKLMPMRGKDKETRASSLRAMILAGKVHVMRRAWTSALLQEFRLFPSATGSGVDDIVDACSLLPRMLSSAGVGGVTVPELYEFFLPSGKSIFRPKGWGDGFWRHNRLT